MGRSISFQSPPDAAPNEESAAARPLLIYDGECGFCGYWARYWQKLTGERVDYAPYQDVAARVPEISIEEFQRAVQYIAPDGTHARAAEASFLTLSHAPGQGIWLWLYRHLPGFAPVSELAYAFVAAHRPAFYVVSRFLWGRRHEPPRHDLVAFLFLRLFGLIYLTAFVSFGVQALGLIGSHGILPLPELTDAGARQLGLARFYRMPMLFWLADSDTMIEIACWAGAACSLALALNLLPRLSLILIHAFYLSLFYAGQSFMAFQWEIFLLETGFVAIILSFATTPGIWLLRWLLFRFMFMSGVVKLASGDPNWWNLSALSYHFLTQPLPTPVAWYAAQVSPGVLKVATGATFVVELILPFFFFLPRHLRFFAAFGTLLLESCIFITGNYNWFNLQTMLLCLPLFDDAAVERTLPRRAFAWLAARAAKREPTRPVAIVAGALALVTVFCSVVELDERFGGRPPGVARAVDELIGPLHIVGGYGLFAVMTTARHEIVLEGSDDGTTWREYEFPWKPGDVMRAPQWNIPHQPRLDWQLWFAALDDPRRVPWFPRFLERVLRNEPAVMALFEKNPFPDKPPVFVRALYYDYAYASPEEKARGQWWDRRLLGVYFPASRLK
ncbi:MAG TPA: lipase maturation factor family protein [Stellaceae bacterium]|nr:lipase maturation factor family protein [Stellaceae bacterium]